MVPATHNTAFELRWLSIEDVDWLDTVLDHSNGSAGMEEERETRASITYGEWQVLGKAV